MRLRKKPWAENELSTNQRVIKNARENKGKWHELFGASAASEFSLRIEIGAGKGKFLSEMAKAHKSDGFIGIEKNENALAVAARRLREADDAPDNLLLLSEDAFYIDELFGEHEISEIYINFCDPWHKKRTAKRRLTHSAYLKKYERLLKINDGMLTFKTDNEALYLFSVSELKDAGWEIISQTRDLHSKPASEATPVIMTEYEEKFFSLGMNIFQIKAAPRN